MNQIENTNLLILETEKECVERRLEDQIRVVRSILDNLESKLKNNQQLYISDGLQGNVNGVDIQLVQLVAYNRGIELVKRQLF